MSAIKLNEVYKPKNRYKVIVKTITFNQSNYIQDTLNGIAMQVTDFPFVSIVLEDCSMDGEQDVIRSWIGKECDMTKAEYYDIPTAEMLIVPHKTNNNCTFAIYFHKENLFRQKEKRESQLYPWLLNSEYMAFCEGDDYWIDPYKLHKQVTFLEYNQSHVISHSGFIFRKGNDNITSSIDYTNVNLKLIESGVDIRCHILDHNKYRIQTCTVLYRIDTYFKVLDEYKMCSSQFLMGDTPLWVLLLSYGAVHFFSDITAVYRLVDNSACHKQDIYQMIRFNLSASEMRIYFCEKYNLGDSYIKRFYNEYNMYLMKYMCLVPSFKPTTTPKFQSFKKKISFYLVTSFPFRYIFRYIYIKNNFSVSGQKRA